jgi:adenylate kinase family enzyme
MYNILIIGRTGSGKTTLAKSLMKNRKHLVFDVNNEYDGFNVWSEVTQTDEFLNHCLNNIRNSIVMIDEASIFFNNRKYSDKLNHLLVKKRHHNNIYILNFHSLRKVPLYIIDFLDFCYLKKTNDTEKILDKYDFNEDFKTAFKEVQQSENQYFYKCINLR